MDERHIDGGRDSDDEGCECADCLVLLDRLAIASGIPSEDIDPGRGLNIGERCAGGEDYTGYRPARDRYNQRCECGPCEQARQDRCLALVRRGGDR